MKLPKANLITALNGKEDSLKQMLIDNNREEFNGYIKATMKRGLVPANGVIVIVNGVPVVAFYHHMDKLFGQVALPDIFRMTKSATCILKLYSFPKEVQDEITAMIEEFSNARVDMGQFWRAVKDGTIDERPAGAASTQQVPKTGFMRDGKDGINVVIGEGLQVLGTDKDGVNVDSIKKQFDDKEAVLRKEIDDKINEREELKKEEEKFLKMDENLTKLLKQREEELNRKEMELAEKEDIIKQLRSRRPSGAESPVPVDRMKVEKEREEIKQREAKLLEMEKMFRRVLANTEERLKKKEEELIEKEEALKKQVSERNQFLDELRDREAKVKELEAKVATNDGSEAARKLLDAETHIARLEQELMAKKNACEMAEGKIAEHEVIHDEVGIVLSVMDILLGRLPQDHIEEFARSEAHPTYKRVMLHFNTERQKQEGAGEGLLGKAASTAPEITEAVVLEAGRSVDDLTKRQEESDRKVRELEERLHQKEKDLAEARAIVMELEQAGKDISEERKELQKESAEIKKARKVIENAQADVAKVEKEWETLRSKERELDAREKGLLKQKEDLDIRIKAMEDSGTAEGDRLEAMKKAESDLLKEIDELRKSEEETCTREKNLKLQLDEKLKTLEEKEIGLEALKEENERIKVEIEALKRTMDDGPKVEADVKRLEHEIGTVKADMEKAREREKELVKDIEQKVTQLAELEKRLETEAKAAMTDGMPDEELLKMLKIMDDLLGKLPEDVVEEFVKSDGYELYERIFDKYGI